MSATHHAEHTVNNADFCGWTLARSRANVLYTPCCALGITNGQHYKKRNQQALRRNTDRFCEELRTPEAGETLMRAFGPEENGKTDRAVACGVRGA